ncbi:diguanylate cyclase, partial [bacterium]|nr:diguanylate cyclase [bacterium]
DYVTKPFDKFELEVRLRAGKRIVELQQELIESRETIRVIAMHDSLTKVYNRGAILDSLRKEFARAERKETTFGVILLDLDHFKKINDTYGHPMGDKVLQGVALNIRESIRPYDSIGRYGGEEFLMILPGCDLLTTASQAERLRMKIERSKVKSEMDDIAVTVSMGVASCRTGQDCSVEHLLVSVDEALYKAKAEGRNRVYMRDAEHSFLPFEIHPSNYEEWV